MALDLENLIPVASGLIFCGFAALTLSGALIAAMSRRLVRSVCGLALSFVGLAGLYYFLNSPFLALMQILIYVGAICVVIMFALMLAEPHQERVSRRREALMTGAGLLVAGMFAAASIILTDRAGWMLPSAQAKVATVQDLGRAILGRYGFAFELISVLLLLAILGALVVARSGRRPES